MCELMMNVYSEEVHRPVSEVQLSKVG